MRKGSEAWPTAPWILRAVLAFLVLIAPSCQARTNASTGPAKSGTASAITPALTATILDPTPAPSVTLALLGDVMLGRDVHPTLETFAYLKPFLKSADLALANLESPLTDSAVVTESPYALCAPPENVSYLADAGFDLLALANNHHLDCGTEGLLETQLTLTESGLGFIGPDPEPVIRSINGIQLAFLAFDATTAFNDEMAVQAVRLAQDAGLLVIVSIHWGMEYQAGASTAQKQIAEQLADAGATLIWGHHPHVLQLAQWIEGDKTLVLYSLGNALFDQYGLDYTRQSALVLVTLESHGVEGFRAIPFLIDSRNSRVIEAEQLDAQRIMQYFK